MATLTQPTQRRGKSVNVNDYEGLPVSERANAPAAYSGRLDNTKEDDGYPEYAGNRGLHSRSSSSNLKDPFPPSVAAGKVGFLVLCPCHSKSYHRSHSTPTIRSRRALSRVTLSYT